MYVLSHLQLPIKTIMKYELQIKTFFVNVQFSKHNIINGLSNISQPILLFRCISKGSLIFCPVKKYFIVR